MKIKDKAKPITPPVAPGTYVAVCVGVIDLGEQYIEKFKKYIAQVQIVWELDHMTVEVDGEQKPRQLSRTFTLSTNKKSHLRAILSSWNGVQYSNEQFGELDLFDQIGKPCMLSVVMNETGEYANIASVIPMITGYPAPQTTTPPIKWDMDNWDDAVFATLPDWIQEKIKKSTQYQKEHPPVNTIDFPANAAEAIPTVNPAQPVTVNPAPTVPAVPANAPANIQSATPVNSTPNAAVNPPPSINPANPGYVSTAPAAPAATNDLPFDLSGFDFV